MNIKRIYIDGFKNLECVDIAISKITGLLSINNYGKSNYLMAINFAAAFLSVPPKNKKYMMSLKGLIPILNSNFGKNFKFEIEFENNLNNDEYSAIYGYEFQWAISQEKESKIVREYLKIKPKNTQKYSLYVDRNNDLSLYKASSSGRCDKEILIKDNELLINKLYAYDDLFYKSIIETLNGFEVYIDRHFDPTSLYQFNPFINKGMDYLSPLSSNGIGRILNELKQKNYPQYELIINTLKNLFPHIEEFEIQEINLSGYEMKEKIENNLPFELAEYEYVLYVTIKNSSKKVQFANMSDGVKRILSILTYITLAELSNTPLIAIEEPENSIHPGLFRKYLITLSNFVKKSKIIITSHSPYLVNFMDLSNIYIGIPSDNSVAKFRKIKDTAVSKINNAAENMDMMVGEYLFDLMSGYDEYDRESLKKYLENE